jgi:uncharacterized membrane protein
MPRILDWLSGRPYLLLTLTMLMWGGNAVAGRLAVGEVSPMALTGLRWVVPVAVLGVALRYQLLTHRQALLERWPSILLMGTLGLTVFNALFYLAAHHTTAVNLTILQGAMPVFVLVGALLFYGTRIHGPGPVFLAGRDPKSARHLGCRRLHLHGRARSSKLGGRGSRSAEPILLPEAAEPLALSPLRFRALERQLRSARPLPGLSSPVLALAQRQSEPHGLRALLVRPGRV